MPLLRSAAQVLAQTLVGALVACTLFVGFMPYAYAERLIARTDAEGDGNFIAQLVAIARSNNSVVFSSPVTLNSPLPAGATVDRIVPSNGATHLVYAAFTGDAAIFDDLFVVEVSNPGVATLLNGAREQGVEAPLIFAAGVGHANVAYALRNFNTGTDRLFVVSVENPGVARLVLDSLPAGATIGDMELSPDGQTLAYRLDQAGLEPQIWMSFLSSPPNGRQIDIAAPLENYQPNEFQFSPDSKHFLWRGKQSLPGRAEPLRMVTLDADRRSISDPVQLNAGLALNEQVFEFEVGPDSEQVYYRAIAGNSTLPGDTFVVPLAQPGAATRLNPPPVANAGFTAQEDLLVLGDRVLYNSAETRADLVELFSVPTDASAVSTRLSASLGLNQISTSASRPGVSHMVASADDVWVALVDGDPAQNLFVLNPDDPSQNFEPFNLTALGRTIELSTRTNRTRRDPFQFSADSQFLAMLADPVSFDPNIDPPDLGSALLVALPNANGSGRSVFPGVVNAGPGNSGTIGGFSWLGDPTALAASALPASRSGQVGATVSAFVAVINGGSVPGRDCRISLDTPVPVAFSYQRTNPATNAVVGKENTPVDIAGGALQTWVVSAQVLAEFSPTEVQLRYGCANSAPVTPINGVNTLLLSGSAGPVPDMVALAATPNSNGILDLPGAAGSAAFSVASINVGSTSTISVSAETSSADGQAATLPVTVSVCETDASGTCINPATPTTSAVSLNVSAGATNSFSVFATGAGNVGDNAATNRVRVVFRDPGGAVRGQTSVAVRTVNP